MADATSARVLLQAGGYCPIPVIGKVPALLAWQKHTQTNAAEIALWRKLYPDAVNTGILTRLNPTVDADLLNEEAAEAIEGLFREYLEERGHFLVRMGRAPKRAILLRTDVPFPKMTRNVTAPTGSAEKIEVLCEGQQVVVFGIHPDTKKPYLWHGGEPGPIKYEDLPYVRADELVALLDQAVALLVRDHGYTAAAERPKATNGAGGHGPEDWGYLSGNIIAAHEVHDSTRTLAAKYAKAGVQASTIVNILRGLYEVCFRTTPLDAKRRLEIETYYADIPRAVESGVRKYGRAEPPPETARGQADGCLHYMLDRPPEGGVMETEWLIENVLPRVGVVILSGHPGVGKTHIFNDMMCSVATGMPFAGHEVTRTCGAALFAAEGANTAPARWEVLRHVKTGPWFESISLPANTPFPVTYTGHVPYLNEKDAFEQYDAELTRVAVLQAEHMAAAGRPYDGLGLVGIDTYNAATSFDEDQPNKVAPNQKIFNMQHRLAVKHGCCFVNVDHLGKDISRGPLGTIAKSASCDGDLRITGTVAEDGSVSHTAMIIHKLRAGPQGERLPFELKAVSMPQDSNGRRPSGTTVRWDAGDGMHVPKQNKRHPALMRALDEALLEKWQWVRLGDNTNFKAADSRLVRDRFELLYPATAAEGGKREKTIRRAFDRAIQDSSKVGLVASKTLTDKSVVLWRTDYQFGDSAVSREVSEGGTDP